MTGAPWTTQAVAAPISDRLRSGRISVDPLVSPRMDDSLPISTPHDGQRMGTRWPVFYTDGTGDWHASF